MVLVTVFSIPSGDRGAVTGVVTGLPSLHLFVCLFSLHHPLLSSAPPTPLTSLVPTIEYYKLVRSLIFCRYASGIRQPSWGPETQRIFGHLCSWHFEAVVSCHIIIYHPCSWLCRENIYNSSNYCVTPQNYSVIPRGHSAMHHAGGGDQLCFGRVIYYSCRPIQYLSSHYEMSSAEHKHNAHWATPFLTMGRRINIFVQTI